MGKSGDLIRGGKGEISVSINEATETLYQIWTQSSKPRWSHCAFNIWPDDLKHCVTCCTWLWDNFHKVWPSTTYPCLNYSVFKSWYDISRCDLDLWP